MTKLTVTDIKLSKNKKPLTCLTSYTYNIAKITDQYADVILVGDSLGMVLYGMETTLPVTIDMMIMHGKAVSKAADKALVVVDMPYGSYENGRKIAFGNAQRIMKETSCTAVKLEGGVDMAETVSYLVQRNVPVMGHIGLKPQSVLVDGGYRMHGVNPSERQNILTDAKALEQSGVFAIVAECVDAELANDLVKAVQVPIIGIGSSWSCDGQIIVTEDLVGLTHGNIPSFVPQKETLSKNIHSAVQLYKDDIQANYKVNVKSAA